MDFRDLPDINFVDVDINKSENETLRILGELLDKDIYPASPERLITLNFLAQLLENRLLIDDVGKMNLLQYARGDYLDAIGAMWDEYRTQEQYAQCTVKFTLSAPISYMNVIPENTRIKTIDGRVFQTTEPIEIQPGEIEKEVIVTALEPGFNGNGVLPGQLNTIIDVFPFFQSVTNITESTGGMAREDDEHFREIIHESPEKLSTTGPEGAYRYWAKEADKNIGDVTVYSPSPGVVNVVPLYNNGDIPGKEALEKIKKNAVARKRRPLTDKVEVLAPTIRQYDVNVNYWLNEEDKGSMESAKIKVEKALDDYIEWQKRRLGRDINPSKLISELVKAGAKRVEVVSPQFTVLKDNEVGHVNIKKIIYKGLEGE